MPRSGRRGSHHRGRVHRRFNEAGAIMPRSGTHVAPSHRARGARFNEAGAIMPRSGRIGPLHEVEAEMLQ